MQLTAALYLVRFDFSMTVPPSKLTRFFTLVNRLISLIVLLALLALGVSMAHTAWLRAPEREPGTVKAKVEDAATTSGSAVVLSFSKAETVSLADTEMVQLVAGDGSDSYSSRSGNEIRNVLFVSGAGKPARWLFNDHKNKISVVRQLRADPPTRELERTVALYVEFTAPGAASSVALARPDGSGSRTVLQDVTLVLSSRVESDHSLIVLYQRDTALRQASISLRDFTVTSEREIEKLPTSI